MKVLFGIMIPFFGTSIGSLMVFFIKGKLSKKVERIMLGGSAGIMIAASIWSLIIPSLDVSLIKTCVGLLIGVGAFYLLDFIMNKYNKNINKLMLSVTIHNIPEGMAVGIIFASYLSGLVSLGNAFLLSIGIGIQNIPEGSIISIPSYKDNNSKLKSFLLGFYSAVFELLGALVTLLFTGFISNLMPYFLSFAAGTMIYVTISELIPESTHKSNINSLGFIFGFLLMMILDVVLS